jgi:5-methylcytosine-specific restriction endonuclease McrA
MSYIPDDQKAENIRAAVTARDGRTCVYCGKSNLKGRRLHLDHRVPKKDNGGFTVDNLVVACSRCNVLKGAASLDAFVTKRLADLERERNALLKLQGSLALSLSRPSELS